MKEFPIYSLNRDKKRQELLKLLQGDYRNVIKDGVITQHMTGLSLAWSYHPHAWSVRCNDMLTPMEVFTNHLSKALTRRKAIGKCESPTDLHKALRAYSGAQGVSNFQPVAALAVYNRYLPTEGGTVWDMSAGYGGRLLGAMTSGRVNRYIGTDPCELTWQGLMDMNTDLSGLMTVMGYKSPSVDLRCQGSEDFKPKSVDLCFTSPPYGSHERYSDEPTQSYIRFPGNERWMNEYMRRTLENCRRALNSDGWLVVNVADTSTYPTLTSDFLSLAKEVGFTLVETLQLSLSAMVGPTKTQSHKHEPVYAFRSAGTIPGLMYWRQNDASSQY